MKHLLGLACILTSFVCFGQNQASLGANIDPDNQFQIATDTCQSGSFAMPIQFAWPSNTNLDLWLLQVAPDTSLSFLSFEPEEKHHEYDLFYSFTDSLYKLLHLQEGPTTIDSLSSLMVVLDKDTMAWSAFCLKEPDSVLIELKKNAWGYEGNTGCTTPLSDGAFFASIARFKDAAILNPDKLLQIRNLFAEQCLRYHQFKELVELFEFDDYKVKVANSLAPQLFEQDSLEQVPDLIFSNFYKSQLQLNKQ